MEQEEEEEEEKKQESAEELERTCIVNRSRVTLLSAIASQEATPPRNARLYTRVRSTPRERFTRVANNKRCTIVYQRATICIVLQPTV